MCPDKKIRGFSSWLSWIFEINVANFIFMLNLHFYIKRYFLFVRIIFKSVFFLCCTCLVNTMSKKWRKKWFCLFSMNACFLTSYTSTIIAVNVYVCSNEKCVKLTHVQEKYTFFSQSIPFSAGIPDTFKKNIDRR